MRQIAINTGCDGGVIVAEARASKPNVGFDANTSTFVDMFAAGIIDPTKVCKTALQNAASLAGLLLTTDTLVTEIKDDEEENVTQGAVH